MTVRAETQIDLTRVDDGTPGTPGANGATFTPSVNVSGDISWTNDGGLPNPTTRNIMGPAGVSISSVTNHYLATSLGSGVTKSTAGWTTTVQSMTSTNQYLWTYETLVGDDSSTISETNPVIIGRYGQNGTNGTNGVGISSIVEWYQISASNSTPPATPSQAGTGYSSNPMAPTSAKPYLWNYEVISYTSGSPTITAARVIGTYGEKGDNGYTPYIQGGYWYINGTSTGVKAEGDDGTTSVWYYGNKITGTSTTPTVFSGSGIANAVVGDMYLNTDNSNVYQCTLGGNASTAKWVYAGTIADGIITVKSVNGSIASFADASEYPALEVITDINAKQAGSGTPSPSNPRAISGYSTIGTYATGTNLLENNVTSQTATVTDTFTIVRNDDGSLTFNGTATGTRVIIGNLATNFVGTSAGQNDGKKHIPNGTWKMTTHCSNTGIRLQVVGTNNPTGTASVTSISTSADTNITIDDTYAYNWVRINITSGTYSNVTIYPTIAPTTDYVYTPFGNSYTTPLPSTVYGGILDVTKGLLTVTHGFLTINGTESYWYAVDSHNMIYNVVYTDTSIKGVHQTTDIVSNMGFTPTSYSYATMDNYSYAVCIRANESSQWRVYVKTENTSLASLKTWLGTHPLQLAYKLATPQTYNVSPQQIQLLQGTNNVWTDSGDVDVKYAIISAGAVEALREPIDNASKVATSYITQIDEGGIKVHDAGDTESYAKITSGGMQIYQANTEVANFDADSVDLGMNGVTSEVTFCKGAGKITGEYVGGVRKQLTFSVDGSLTESPPSTSSTFLLNATETGSTYITQGELDLSDYECVLQLNEFTTSNTLVYNRQLTLAEDGLSYWSTDYANNQAQIHVGYSPINGTNTKYMWIGVGAGGANHGLYSETESAWIAMSDGTYNYTGNSFGPYVTSSGSDGYYLGWSTKRWRGVYSYNAPNSVSDKKHKDIIGDIDFAKDLIMNLKPVEYQWKESDHKRTHMGLIAQDSAEVAKELGKDLSFYEAQYIDGSDYHGEETDDANLNWGMMYTELIAPLIKVVQEQQHEIDELKERIDALERK